MPAPHLPNSRGDQTFQHFNLILNRLTPLAIIDENFDTMQILKWLSWNFHYPLLQHSNYMQLWVLHVKINSQSGFYWHLCKAWCINNSRYELFNYRFYVLWFPLNDKFILIYLFQPPPPLHAPGYENNFHRKPINTHFFLLVKTIDSILFIISACHENANDHLLFSC